MILSEKSATFRDHALDGSCSTRKTQSIDPTQRFSKREGDLLATTGVGPDSARSGVPEHQRASENHEQALESRNATFVEQHYFPYIRDGEILDSIKTHVLKKMARIGRFRR